MQRLKFLDQLLCLCETLENEKIQYMLLGGIAVGMWAQPRATLDIDLLISVPEEDLDSFKSKIKSKGFVVFNKPLIKLKKVKIFRFFVKGHSEDDMLMVDAILADDEYKRNALSRCEKISLKEIPIKVSGPEDLVLFKLLAGRDQDIVDIENIVELHEKALDKEYLISWGEKLGVKDDLVRFIH